MLNRKLNDIRKDFKRQYEIISSSYEFYENLNKKRQKLDDYYLTNFRKHCADCDNECYHNCSRHSSKKFLIVTENGVVKDKFKYVMCYDCKKVFPSSMIQAYCNSCNTEFFTSILERNEDPDLLKATWSKYHCEQIINKEKYNNIILIKQLARKILNETKDGEKIEGKNAEFIKDILKYHHFYFLQSQ